MEIRRVTDDDDFDAIAGIYAASWKAAYRGIVPQAYLDALTGARWAGRLRNSHNSAVVLLDGGRYVGTSSYCAARDPEMAGWGEVMSLYLLPDYFGRGIGAPLLAASVAELRNMGFDDCYLWVLVENHRARRFYEKNGFQCTGETATIVIGEAELQDTHYVRRGAEG